MMIITMLMKMIMIMMMRKEDDEHDHGEKKWMVSPDCLDGTTKQRRRLFVQELENVSSLFAVLELVE